MKTFNEQIKKHGEKVRMRASERRELRERVFSYMEYHPLPKQKKEAYKQVELIESQNFITVGLSNMYVRSAIGFFAVLIVIVVPSVAQRSLPGDVLYPVKVQITEGIQLKLTISPYKKVALETRLLERRIAEARLLADEGKLTDEVEADIVETVKAHADAVQVSLAELREDDSEVAAIAEIAYESALAVQSAVLEEDIEADVHEEGTSVAAIAETVSDAEETADAAQSHGVLPYDLFIAEVESETTRAYELFETIDPTVTDEERLEIERRLDDIDRAILTASQLDQENQNESAGALRTVLVDVKKLVAFMTDIDVRENVILETLLPVILTDEEQVIEIKIILEDVSKLQIEIESRIEQIEDGEFLEKVGFGLEEVATLVAHSTTSLEASNIESARDSAFAAQAFVADLDTLTFEFHIKETEETLPEPESSEEENTEDIVNVDEVEVSDTEETSEEVVDIPVE